MQSMEENPQKSKRRLSEELGASKGTIHRQIKILEKTYRSCISVPHTLTPQEAQLRMDICRQFIGNPMDDRSIYQLYSSPTFPSLHLRHSSFSNPSVALPTSQLILQIFRCFTYVTVHSPALLLLLLRHKLFT